MLTKASKKLTKKKIPNGQVDQCLKVLHKFIQTIPKNTNTKSLVRIIYDKFSEKIEFIIRGQFANSFADLRNKFLFYIIQLKEKAEQVLPILQPGQQEEFRKEMFQ